jgi:phosphatidylserine decarboxylase
MIRFGSRTDCYVPRSTDIRIEPGDRVFGGTSVLGVMKS